MSVTDILRWVYSFLEYPWAILLAVILIPLSFWILKKQFVKVAEDLSTKQRKLKVQGIMKWTRAGIIILLLIAIASPYIQDEKVIEGDPFVQVLIDNSTSMALFDDVSQQLVSRLQSKTNTEVKYVGSGMISNIGDAVLNNLQPYSSVVLLSDGNVNSGSSLGDVALYASRLNSSVNAIKLNTRHKDASVEILGPSKVLEDAESSFVILINKAGELSGRILVTIDGETVLDEQTGASSVQVKKKLSPGTHRIVARFEVQDYFPNNNVAYKTVKVVAKPKVLYYGASGPLEQFLNQLYIVERVGSLPAKLQEYYAIVVNDVGAGSLNSVSDVLSDYTADGNGLIVVGGENSFDKGEYRNSLFETLLPVQVGSPEKKEGDVLVAIVIDISGSQGSPFGRFASTADFSKAATIDIMRNMKIDTRVAIVAFNTQAYLLSEPTPIFAKSDVEDVISRLKWGGGTNVAAGLLKAAGVLNQYAGSKNIILLSDGKTQAKAAAIEAAKFAANSGMKIYTVGVGPTTDEEFMMDTAELTNGIYFRATEESKLRIIFGDVDEQEAQTGQMELVILNANHFVTAGVEPKGAVLYGFNQVSPKPAGQLLATTSTGEPVLTIWRLGLGRVGALTVDDGSKWAGSLLSEANGKLLVRMMNWAIGDPERKSLAFIDALDTRLGEPTEITVRSDVQPEAPNVVFYKIDDNTYSGSLLPTQVGFQDVAGATFAVNYESEFQKVGINPELESIVGSTGGRMFGANDIDEIVEHAKSKATRVITGKQYLRGPFVALAALLFLLEIFIRRIMRKE